MKFIIEDGHLENDLQESILSKHSSRRVSMQEMYAQYSL